MQCKIFNRYGTLIYEWNDPLGYWDGTSLQTKEQVSEGAYYYVATVETFDGQLQDVTGFIQLMR